MIGAYASEGFQAVDVGDCIDEDFSESGSATTDIARDSCLHAVEFGDCIEALLSIECGVSVLIGGGIVADVSPSFFKLSASVSFFVGSAAVPTPTSASTFFFPSLAICAASAPACRITNVKEDGCPPAGAFDSSTVFDVSEEEEDVGSGFTFSFCETCGFAANGFGGGIADFDGVVNSS